MSDTGTDSQDALPLANVRVVDLTRVVAGSHATRILADLGAEVIKVESFHGYDPMRVSNPVPGGEPESLNRSPLWANLNRNKRSVSLNLWHPDALELLKRLIGLSDILVENFRPRVMARWGLTYEDAARLHPDIIYVSITGFGHSGRYKDYVTFGPTAQALSGLTDMSGLPDCQPAGIGFSYLDHLGGYNGAIAALAALHFRRQSGQGQHIDVTQIESGAAVTGPVVLDRVMNNRPYQRPGNHNRYRRAVPEGVYPCKGEDQWCAITVYTDQEWQGLCEALGNPQWAQDSELCTMEGRVRHQEELDARLAEHTRTFPKHELMELLQRHGVAAGAVQSPEDRAENDPQLTARGFFWKFQHSEFGVKPTDGLPFTFSQSRMGESLRPAPTIDQDNDYVLRHLLNIPDDEVERLTSEGAI